MSQFFLEEDRDAVLLQLQELKRIHDENPNLIMIAGHDISQMTELLKSGAIVKGFR